MRNLAVFSPHLGIRSETFIERHITGLAPGRTVAISQHTADSADATWSVNCPVLVTGQRTGLYSRIPGLGRSQLLAGWSRKSDARLIERFLRSNEVSVLLGEYLDSSWNLLPLARDMGIDFFAHAHGYDLSINYRDELWRNRYAEFAFASGLIVVNKLMRSRLEAVGIAREKIHIVPYGIDVPAEMRKREEKGVLNCLAVGRMVAKKAPIKLLSSFRLALLQNPSLHLDLVGTGPLYQEANEFVRSKGLDDKIRLHGGCSNENVLKLMSEADCFLQHSIVDPDTGDEEGLPVAILEAMSQGLPVVSTKHAGISEAVVQEITGLLVEEGDIDGMAEAVAELSKDYEKRSAMGRAGWARALEHYSWEREKIQLQSLMGL